ncbi:MAG: thioredoxin family protein [Planctomycetota bacterium]|nr:thioredoxin family protein [Planctomycetota bacterium]
MYLPPDDDEQTPAVLRYSHRGFMQGGGRVPGLGKVEVILVDFNQDGQFTLDRDRWALAPAGDRETLYDPRSGRAMSRHNWIEDKAFKAVSLTADGRELRIAPTTTEHTREEEQRLDDPYHADKQEPHSGPSVKFLHDFEKAEKMAKKKGKILLVDFETTWCGPCAMMDKYVYSADKLVAAAKDYVCVKVDGDIRKDLKKRFVVTRYPTLILLDPHGEEIGRRVGYQSVAGLSEWFARTGKAD